MYVGKKGIVLWIFDKIRLLENVLNKIVIRLLIFKKNENNIGNERVVGSRVWCGGKIFTRYILNFCDIGNSFCIFIRYIYDLLIEFICFYSFF